MKEIYMPKQEEQRKAARRKSATRWGATIAGAIALGTASYHAIPEPPKEKLAVAGCYGDPKGASVVDRDRGEYLIVLPSEQGIDVNDWNQAREHGIDAMWLMADEADNCSDFIDQVLENSYPGDRYLDGKLAQLRIGVIPPRSEYTEAPNTLLAED